MWEPMWELLWELLWELRPRSDAAVDQAPQPL